MRCLLIISDKYVIKNRLPGVGIDGLCILLRGNVVSFILKLCHAHIYLISFAAPG